LGSGFLIVLLTLLSVIASEFRPAPLALSLSRQLI